MANIIAVVWNFDKTLVDGYMQDPIFEEYGVDSTKFWSEVNALPDKYLNEQGVKVNKDTIYLNHFFKYVREGIFHGLSNEKLLEFGKKLKFYKGVSEIFARTKEVVDMHSADIGRLLVDLVERNLLLINSKGRWTSYILNEKFRVGVEQLQLSGFEPEEINFKIESDKLIYQYILSNGFITTAQVTEITKISTKAGASVAINRLIKAGLVRKERIGKSFIYKLV